MVNACDDLEEQGIGFGNEALAHDRTGYLEDLNTIFPLDRLAELAANGEIGSVADYHYSFMGATNPLEMRPAMDRLAGVLKGDGVNTVVFAPV